MVATVVGARLGVQETSAWVLGGRGQLGASALGRGGENLFVNAATGNLVVTRQDEFLVGLGGNASTSRAYNSQGALNDDNGDNWRFSIQRRLTGFPASPNTAGSTITRIGEDGSELVYAWDGAVYRSSEGAGADDTLTRASDGQWTWTDGDTQVREFYDAGGVLNSSADSDGHLTHFSYHLHNNAWRLSRVTTPDGGYTDIVWSGENVSQLTSTYTDRNTGAVVTRTRTRYGYDSFNRLTSVTVDLSPEDGSVSDGNTYVTSYTYDGSSRRITSISQTDGSRVDIVYETGGQHRVLSVAQSVAQNVSRITRYAYLNATTTEVTSPDGLTTRLEYNSAGQLLSITEPPAASGVTPRVTSFAYYADGSVYTEFNGSKLTYFYYDGGPGGLWTSRYEALDVGYLLTRRTFDARGALLTETRHETPDTTQAGAAAPMTTRYVYDSENHLRFEISATGGVTRHDYDAAGNRSRTTIYTGQSYDLTGLVSNQSLSEATMIAWAAAVTEKTKARVTDYYYDFRGLLSDSYAWADTDTNGNGGGGYSRTSYIHDQAGRLVARNTNGAAGWQSFVYDGLGRLILSTDLDGATTRTTYYDRSATTVETTADGLNKVSVYNRAGERVSYSESERGPNLVDNTAWPEYDPNLPAGHAYQGSWYNWYAEEARWQTNRGPDGDWVATMQAGQTGANGSAGGGSHGNPITIDRSQSYEFTYYFRRDALDHAVYFGLGSGVVEGLDGVDNDNPYFTYIGPDGLAWPAAHAPTTTGVWYKVVGQVLAEGSTTPATAATGVFNVETGQKIADVQSYRWRSDPTTNQTHTRFFDYYWDHQTGYSTQYYKPEVRSFADPGVNLVDLTGWPGPASALNGPATVPGWQNNWSSNETAWKLIDGPKGTKVVAMQAGQYNTDHDGGGAYTNEVAIDASKSYEFTYYVRREKGSDHYIYMGLSSGAPAYVEYAYGGHGAEVNPYFLGAPPEQTSAYMEEDRWYRVVGHVLAQGSADVAAGSLGGVYDLTTGQKVADTQIFRWRADRPGNSVHARFFTYYESEKTGFSTYFYTPEIRRTDQPAVNLVAASGWPQPIEPDLAGQPVGWNNMWQSAETRWRLTTGPDGRPTYAIQSGQFDGQQAGGGNYTNAITIDPAKAYEFSIYLRKEDLEKHSIYWGLTSSDPAYVEHAVSGATDTNPYFLAAPSSWQQSHLVEDRWYKVVGYVLPQGTGNLTWAQAPGGIYDTVTGERVGQPNVFRWSGGRPDNQVFGRFFTYYDEGKPGWSTSFYKPEVRAIDLATTPNLVDNSGWAQLNNVPSGQGWPTSWNNPGGAVFAQETRWANVKGPNGQPMTAIEAGQWASNVEGGGGYTNKVRVDTSSAYKFVYYFRKHDTTKHNLYFGLSSYHDAAYVEYLSTGAAESNPYFMSWGTGAQQAHLDSGKWYRVEGWVLPAGSPLSSTNAPGGVFDAETGQKVADVSAFRWRSTTPTQEVAGRFFTFYDEGQTGYSTYFGQPEIHRVDLSKITSPLPADATTHRYDKAGRLRMTTDPTGRSIHVIYDNLGRKTGEVDGDGSLTEYRYDANDRLAATVRYATRLTAADIASLTDGAGNPAPTDVAWIRPGSSAEDAWTWQVHDRVGRLVQTIDGDGSTTLYTYDAASRLISETRYANRLTASQLSGFTQAAPAALVAPPASAGVDRTTRYFYDAADRRIGVLDAEGFFTRTVYDAAGQVIQTSAYANPVSTSLRETGTFAAITGSLNASADDIHNWAVHDARGLLVGTVNGEGDVVLYDYNPHGQLIQTTSGRRMTPPSAPPTLAQLQAATAGTIDMVIYDRNHLGQITKEYRYTAAGREDVTYTYDVMHRLVGTHVDRVAGAGTDSGTRNRYDLRGRLIGQLDGRGAAALAALGADPTGAQVDAVYRTWGVTFAYDAADRLISRTDPDGWSGPGLTTFYYYDGDGALAYEVNAMGEVKGFLYDAQNRRTQTITYAWRISTSGLTGGDIVPVLPSRTSLDAADSRVVTTYNVDDTVRSSTDPLNATTQYAWNAFNELAEQQTPSGVSTEVVDRFGYDRRGLRVHAWEDALGLNRATYTAYDAFGRANYTVDGRGVARTTLHDRAGRVKVVRDGLNAETVYAYDPRGNVVSITDPLGKVTTISHSALNRTQSVTTAEGLVTTKTFDDQGHVLSVTDGGGRTTSYAYDADGQLVTVTNGLGQQEVTSYDTAGRLYERTDASGVKVRYGYDSANRVLSETVDPAGLALTTTYVYDGKGQRVGVIDPSGKRTDHVFDKAGRLTEVIVDPQGAAIRTLYTHDRAGNVIGVTEAAGTYAARTTTYVHDPLGRLVSQQTGPASLNIRSAWTYDANDNVVQRLDGVAAGVDVATRFVYDAEGRLTWTIDANGAVIRNHYDAAGRLVRTTGYATTVSIAGAALTEAQLISALGGSATRTTDHVYDDDGRLVFTRDAAGQLSELAYDGSGLAVRRTDYARVYVTSAIPTEAELRSWVATWGATLDRTSISAYDAAGRQTHAMDAAGQVTSFAHDAAGRTIRSVQHAVVNPANGVMTSAQFAAWAAANVSSGDRKTHVAHDSAGRAAFSVDAEGYATRTTWRPDNQIATTSRFAPQLSVSDGVSHATLASLVAAHEGTAATTAFGYDGAGRHWRTIDAEGVETRLELDGLGRTVQVRRAYGTADEAVTNRSFDEGGRLIAEVVAPGAAEQAVRKWTYDGLGRVTHELSGVAYDRWLNGLDHYYTTYTYDGMGRVLTKTVPLTASASAVTTHTYDAFGNLTRTIDPRGHAGFFYYDNLGRLSLQVDPEGYATRTTYSRGGEVETVTRHATRTSGTPTLTTPPTVHTASTDAVTTFSRDKLDRVTAVTDAQGHTESYALNAFGDRVTAWLKSGGVKTWTYDRRGLALSEALPVSSTAANGTVLATEVVNTFQYDARGNLTRTVEAANIAADARTTHYVYDRLDRLVQTSRDTITVTSSTDFSTSAATPTETIAYDRRGNVILTTNAAGARTWFWYDDADRKIAEVDALGGLKSWTYDDNNNATSERAWSTPVALPASAGGTPPAGSGEYRETLFAYDRNNRRISATIQNVRVGEYASGYTTSVVNLTTQQVYDAAGNVVQTIDGRGVSSFAFFDALGRQVAAVDGEGYLTVWTRDAEGNVLREVRYSERVIGTLSPSRDPATLPPRGLIWDSDRITDFTYDRNGRRLTETRYSVGVYDGGSAGYLTQAHATVTYAYDALGNVTRKTWANGDYTDYLHDYMGRQIRELGMAFVNDQSQWVRKQTDTAWNGLGLVTRTSEDAQGAFAGNQRTSTFTYDKGRLTSATDANGFTRSYGHDVMGRVVSETWYRQRGDVDGATALEGRRYGYDLLGRLTLQGSASYAGGWSFGDTREDLYNAHGEVAERRLNGVMQEQFRYDNAGRLYRSTGGDGVARLFLHDAAGRVSATMAATTADLRNWTAADMVHAYTVGGSVAIGAHNVAGAALVFTRYDNRGLVTDTLQPFAETGRDLSTGVVQSQTLTTGRAYNAFGEVLSETDARGFITDYTYNTIGRLIEARRPMTAYTNEQGQVLSARPTEQYRYDIAGRLVATRTANGHWSSRTLLAGTGHNGTDAVVSSEYRADGGQFYNYANVFGELVYEGDGLGGYVTNIHDKVGNLIERRHIARTPGSPGNPSGSTVQLIDSWAYDGLGQRIGHWNNQFGAGYKERTSYDREGRIVGTTDFEGRWTTHAWSWNSNLTTGGLGTFGGWVQTTAHASGKTSSETTDGFGRIIGKSDMGGRSFTMGYDLGGRMVSRTGSNGQSLGWDWFNTGLQARQSDHVYGSQTDFAYDAAGNRTRERYYTGGAVQQDGFAEYDALGRMTKFEDRAANASDPTRSLFTYDLNGNVRSTQSWSRRVDQSGGVATSPAGGGWFRYDSMNRMVHADGALVDGQITNGKVIEYDAAGNRRRVLTASSVQTDNIIGYSETWVPYEDPNPGGPVIVEPEDPGNPGSGYWRYDPIYETRPGYAAEVYTYTADGYLATVGRSHDEWNTNTDTVQMSAVQIVSQDTRDAMGRVLTRTEWSGERQGVNVSYERQSSYDRSGLVVSTQEFTYKRDNVFTNTTAHFATQNSTYSYHEGSTWRGVVMAVTTTGHTDPWPQGGSTQAAPATRTDYTYNWWDEARQSTIAYDSNTGSGSNPIHTSTFTLDLNGRVSSVYIGDDRPRTVTFVTDANGQVLTRTEQDNNPNLADPMDRYYYFGGQRIGQVTNNVAYATTYYGEMFNRGWTGPTQPTPFRHGNYAAYGVDFDLAYEAITPSSVRDGGTSWTVRTGETLQSIAAATWGDASLWYLIAEANGLTAGSLLGAGQRITVPAKIGNVHNNTDTFRPYDPNEAIGNVNPTQTRPPKNGNGCGVIGQVIMTVIAVAVAAALAQPMIAGAAKFFAGLGLGTTATGSAAATAVVAKTGGGVAVMAGSQAGVAGAIAGGAMAGAAGSVASQAFGLATGIQGKFDWKGVALNAISGAVGAGLKAPTALGKAIGRLPTHVQDIAGAAAASVLTQGVSVAVGLQSSFSWSSVAVSAISAKIRTHLPLDGMAGDFTAGVLGVGVQSLVEGSSFETNLRTQLPQIVGQTIGNAIAGGINVQATAGTKRPVLATLENAQGDSGFDPLGQVRTRKNGRTATLSIERDLYGTGDISIAWEEAGKTVTFAGKVDGLFLHPARPNPEIEGGYLISGARGSTGLAYFALEPDGTLSRNARHGWYHPYAEVLANPAFKDSYMAPLQPSQQVSAETPAQVEEILTPPTYTNLTTLSAAIPAIASSPIDQGSSTAKQLSEMGRSFLGGLIKGDYSDDDSIAGIAGQVIGGFNPLADIRDLSAAFVHVSQGREGAWIDVVASGVGFIPIAGDIAKPLIKHGDKMLAAAHRGGAVVRDLRSEVDALNAIGRNQREAAALAESARTARMRELLEANSARRAEAAEEAALREASYLPPGSFSISDWSGYPADVPRPQGPFRLIEGAEYDAARTAANRANAAIRREQDLVGQPVDVHEIQPVKFGGSATDPSNKIVLPRDLHRQQVTPWWNQLQRDLGQ